MAANKILLRDVDIDKYFIYRHVRLDTNKVFYIGRGKAYIRAKTTRKWRDNKQVGVYWRAFNKNNRHYWWKRVTAKTDYEVEIIYESNDFEDICSKEKEFILLYGRQDLKTGTLINMSDGGDGAHNMSQYSRNLLRKAHEESGNNQKMREERSIPICLYDFNGKFLIKCKDKYECAKYLNCSYHTINAYLYKKYSLNDCLLSREYNINGISTTGYNIFKPKLVSIEMVVNDVVVGIFNSVPQAAKAINTYEPAIRRSIETGKPIKGVLWRKGVESYKIKKAC